MSDKVLELTGHSIAFCQISRWLFMVSSTTRRSAQGVSFEMDTKRNKGPKLLGRHIVADPAICHGEPTFRGTRIFVADVLEQVATGMVWEAIIEEWNGSITKEAIAEAVQLASKALLTHTDEFALEAVPV